MCFSVLYSPFLDVLMKHQVYVYQFNDLTIQLSYQLVQKLCHVLSFDKWDAITNDSVIILPNYLLAGSLKHQLFNQLSAKRLGKNTFLKWTNFYFHL